MRHLLYSATILLSVSFSLDAQVVNQPGGGGSGGGSSTFDAVGSGTNTTATMTVGAGAQLTYTSTGIINASKILGAALTSLTGITRMASGVPSAAELSGDATTSGSNAVTVVKVNGVTISGTPATGYVPTATSSTTATWKVPGGYSPPLIGSYTWVNQGNATAVNTYGPLDIVNTNTGGQWSFSCLVRTIPAAPYRFSALIMDSAVPAGITRAGLVLRDSVSGKLITFELLTGTALWQLNSDNLTNATTISGQNWSTVGTLGYPSGGVWLSIYDDNTTRHFQLGIGDVNHVYWWDIASQSRTTFMTPDQIGYAVQGDSASATAYLRILHESTSL